jgi:hypothetical protein
MIGTRILVELYEDPKVQDLPAQMTAGQNFKGKARYQSSTNKK